ncbi:2418_t:CDS:2, partial [Scutellospora calospora]
ATKAKSLLEDQVIQDKDNNIRDTLSKHDDDNDTDYKEISETKATKLSPCIIVDNLNSAIGHCNSMVFLKSLVQLVSTCEVELTPDESLNLAKLEIYSNHFNFDHEQLHSFGTKQLRHYTKGLFNLLYSQNENKKEEVLQYLIKLLENLELSSSTSIDTDFNLSSPLLVKIAMKINRFNDYLSTDKKLIKVEESYQFEEMLEKTICNSCKDIEKN